MSTESGVPGQGSDPTYFEQELAHAFIIGSAVFGIFWGVVNALLIRDIDCNDEEVIAAACREEGLDGENAGEILK